MRDDGARAPASVAPGLAAVRVRATPARARRAARRAALRAAVRSARDQSPSASTGERAAARSVPEPPPPVALAARLAGETWPRWFPSPTAPGLLVARPTTGDCGHRVLRAPGRHGGVGSNLTQPYWGTTPRPTRGRRCRSPPSGGACVVRAGGEADRDARRDSPHPEQQRHRARELLAVAQPEDSQEGLRAGTATRQWVLVVRGSHGAR